jgi:hypothetical protein
MSTLFYTIITDFSFIISKATKCSYVYGYGHDILAATNNNAESMTAAPVNIVDIRISCPGQSTNDTCLINFINS